MQILFQNHDGSRVPISQNRYVDLKLRYNARLRTVFRERHIHVICIAGNEHKRPAKPLKYGGGSRQRNPFDHDLRRSVNSSMWKLDNQ